MTAITAVTAITAGAGLVPPVSGARRRAGADPAGGHGSGLVTPVPRGYSVRVPPGRPRDRPAADGHLFRDEEAPTMTEHHTPSQAEGDRDDEERTASAEQRPTPSQAEGDRDDAEESTVTGEGDTGT
ncbi:hypothetical protein [Streptomyces sp. Tu 3180]|uniref:hypothetical protein n=1 Tax=Streptomyces sp. Tu 3180 TaxID=2682611 RepID=UPI00135A40BD|nr:hypothetical protein [Streptomyces sp. Tu 3180]KAF3463143.1 hypothetical protein GL259_13555 [Streptomyces sp. Tu 3180]